MIDLDKFMDSCKPYQSIIDEVTFDECISVSMGITIGCNREEMIKMAIIQRLYELEQLKAYCEVARYDRY